MAVEKHGTGSNRSTVENPEPTPRKSEKHVGGDAWIAPEPKLPFPQPKIDGADPQK